MRDRCLKMKWSLDKLVFRGRTSSIDKIRFSHSLSCDLLTNRNNISSTLQHSKKKHNNIQIFLLSK